MTYSKSYEL